MPINPPFTASSYIEVWESAFSKFVSETYGRPWRMQQQGEMLGQDTYSIIEVDGVSSDGWDVGEEQTQLDEWLALPYPDPALRDEEWLQKMTFEREHGVSADVILWDLCRRGIIEPGKYLILVWW